LEKNLLIFKNKAFFLLNQGDCANRFFRVFYILYHIKYTNFFDMDNSLSLILNELFKNIT